MSFKASLALWFMIVYFTIVQHSTSNIWRNWHLLFNSYFHIIVLPQVIGCELVKVLLLQDALPTILELNIVSQSTFLSRCAILATFPSLHLPTMHLTRADHGRGGWVEAAGLEHVLRSVLPPPRRWGRGSRCEWSRAQSASSIRQQRVRKKCDSHHLLG